MISNPMALLCDFSLFDSVLAPHPPNPLASYLRGMEQVLLKEDIPSVLDKLKTCTICIRFEEIISVKREKPRVYGLNDHCLAF